jgi:hypothetical protein
LAEGDDLAARTVVHGLYTLARVCYVALLTDVCMGAVDHTSQPHSSIDQTLPRLTSR